MKQFFLQFILILVLTAIAQSFLAWWTLVLVGILAGVLFGHQSRSFLAGFLGVGLLWLGYAFYLSSGESGMLLPDRMGALFGDLSGFMLVLVTALLGGLLGGLGAWTGAAGRALLAD